MPWAQFNLGFMCQYGQLEPRDYPNAVVWYQKAAREGVASAQFNLGSMYTLGHGVKRDLVQAHVWLNLAGVSGNPIALKNRDAVAASLTPMQLARAQKLSRAMFR